MKHTVRAENIIWNELNPKFLSNLNKVLKEEAYKNTTIIPPRNITTIE